MDNNKSITQALSRVASEAHRVDEYMRLDLEQLRPTVDPLLMEVLEYGLFNGGKRIRPLLVVMAARLCGQRGEESYPLSIGFEYLHAATLFHDDIIDQSHTRRGKPSVYKQYGEVAAILAGDFLHAHSMALVGRLGGQGGLTSFSRATKALVDGEFMQLRNARKHNLSELDYYSAIMGKTGLLIAAACEVGAIFGGGSQAEIQSLKRYGENMGCAFQIADDLLDYLGDSKKTGKKIGNDLAEGKMTLPLILAIKNAAPGDKSRLLEIVADQGLRQSCFAEVFALIEQYRGFSGAKKRAQEAVAEAENSLQTFSSGDQQDEQKFLQALARYVITREK